MKDSVELKKKVSPSGDWGDTGSSGEPEYYRGNLEASSGRKVFKKGKKEILSTHLLMMEPASFTGEDEIFVNGKQYEILFIADSGSHLEVDLGDV